MLRLAFIAGAGAASLPAIAQSSRCPDVRDVLLTNGDVHTMDDADRVVSSVRVIGDRVVAVGDGRLGATRCSAIIDVQGRTVVPGLIDNHNHIVLLGLRPGHDTRLESAASIEDVLDTMAARTADVPAGEWLTSIGGFDINQFVPQGTPRFPTLAELDSVTPRHPVYIQQSFAGPGVTNTLGKRFFEGAGIPIGADGSIGGGFQTPNPSTRALFELRRLQTFEDMKRGTLDALRYAASLGLTTHLDQGGFPAAGTDADGAAHFDRYRAYDALLELHRERRLPNRIRLNFLHMEADPATPELAARLANVFPDYGNGMLKIVGIGEFTAGTSPIIAEASEAWVNGTRKVAAAGWRNENHSLTPTDFQVIIDGWERVANELGGPASIADSRWVLAHAPFITREYADRLAALGGGVSVLGGWRYVSGTAQQNGPPFRMLVDSGIPVGMSSDGMQISPMNPWIGLYYVVTGRNARGELINAGQTLTRAEALRLYTAANGWFLNEENELGTLAPGKFADLAVLNADYFDADAVSDDELKQLRSVLTLVGGEVVHGDPDAL
jgi:hypothetical protein